MIFCIIEPDRSTAVVIIHVFIVGKTDVVARKPVDELGVLISCRLYCIGSHITQPEFLAVEIDELLLAYIVVFAASVVSSMEVPV